MTKLNRILIGILLVTVLSVLAWSLLRAHDDGPAYQGKTLGQWLMQLNSSYPDGMDSSKSWQAQMSSAQLQAAEAIRQMGTNALPYLIHALTNVNSRRKESIISDFRRLVGVEHSRRPPGGEQRKAAFGLAALGPMAISAIPELTRAMDDPLLSAQAAVARASIGSEGWAVLSREISSTNSFAAHYAIKQLANYHAAVPGTVEALMAKVRSDASAWIYLSILVRMGQVDQRMVPFLTSFLQSSNVYFRLEAVYGLQAFGTNARSAVPALINLLNDVDPTVRRAATNSLKQIDGDAAAKAGVK